MGGRPRKPSGLRAIEGNRSRTDIPPDMPLPGFPVAPDYLGERARQHFSFVAAELSAIGVTKRLDTEALSILGDLWEKYWLLSSTGEIGEAMKVVGKWMSLAGRFGLTPADRAKIMATPVEKPDADEERFFKVTG